MLATQERKHGSTRYGSKVLSPIFANHSSTMFLRLKVTVNGESLHYSLLSKSRKKPPSHFPTPQEVCGLVKFFYILQPDFISLPFLWFSLYLLSNTDQKTASVMALVFLRVQIRNFHLKAQWLIENEVSNLHSDQYRATLNLPLSTSCLKFSHFVEARDP